MGIHISYYWLQERTKLTPLCFLAACSSLLCSLAFRAVCSFRAVAASGAPAYGGIALALGSDSGGTGVVRIGVDVGAGTQKVGRVE